MKISEIKVNNFKSISNYDFIPDKINIIAGKNRIGKTSLLQAIRFGLTGEIDINPIPFGKTESTVELDVDGIKVEREYIIDEKDKSSVKTIMNGEEISKKNFNTYIESETQIKPEITKIMTSSEIFENMDKGKLNDFLFSNEIIPVTIDTDIIENLCDFTDDSKELFLKTISNAQNLSIDDVKECYQELYADRRVAKKELTQLKAQSEYGKEPPQLSVKEIEDNIEKCNNLLSDIKLYNEKLKLYNDRIAEIEKMKEERKEIIAKYKDYASRIKTKPDMKQIEKFKTDIKKCDDEIGAAKKTIGVIEGNTKILDTTLSKIDTPICPLSNNLICKTDKTQAKNELEAQINKNNTELDNLRKQIDFYTSSKTDIQTKLDEYENYVREYNDFYQLHLKVKEMKKDVIATPEQPQKPTQEEADIKKSLSEYKNMKKEADLYAESLNKKVLADNLAKEIKIMDEVIKKLSPKGDLYNKILSLSIDPLNDYCEKRAGELGLGIDVKIKAEDGIVVLYKSNNNDFISINNASASEKLFITFIIMDMINSLTGLNVMFIDNLDKLDDNSFNKFMEFLQSNEVQNTYDQIFMSMVLHGKEEEKVLNDCIKNNPNTKWINLIK